MRNKKLQDVLDAGGEVRKVVRVKYHPGDVWPIALRYVTSPAPLTGDEIDRLVAYRERWDPCPGDILFTWCHALLASEFAARQFDYAVSYSF